MLHACVTLPAQGRLLLQRTRELASAQFTFLLLFERDMSVMFVAGSWTIWLLETGARDVLVAVVLHIAAFRRSL